MLALNKLIKKVQEYRVKKAELKIRLEVLENKKYLEWKENNPKDRTAKDKVLAELKMNDKTWQKLEIDYINASNYYSYFKDILNSVEGILNNPTFEKYDIEIFLQEFDDDIY